MTLGEMVRHYVRYLRLRAPFERPDPAAKRHAPELCRSAARLIALCGIAACASAVSGASATADPSLREMLDEASSCSNVLLKEFASSTCESPEKIAAQAVAKCQAKWNAVSERAVGKGSSDTSPQERVELLRRYSEAMEYEYIRIAELKAIDMRTAAGRCGFEP